MNAVTQAAANADLAAKPKPFPPRELKQCQQRLLALDALLSEWHAIGKADGIHGEQVRAILHPEEKT